MTPTEAKRLCQDTLRSESITGWRFVIGTARTRFGVCKYRTKTIEVSDWVFRMMPEKVRDTVLHECAHAIAGSAAKHGPLWRAVAVRLGADPKSRHDVPQEVRASRGHSYEYKCGNCGSHIANGFRRRKTLTTRKVSRCCRARIREVRVA